MVADGGFLWLVSLVYFNWFCSGLLMMVVVVVFVVGVLFWIFFPMICGNCHGGRGGGERSWLLF